MIALAGATGLVGGLALDMFLARGVAVTAVGRRPSGRDGAREVVADLTRAAPSIAGPFDAAVCALGTTIAKAGGQAAFSAVDHDAVLHFARAARDAGATRFVLVSSVGADARSSNFYLRVKGETEAAVEALGFERLDLLRPGLLLGERAERRPGEAWGQRLAPFINPLLRGPLTRYAAIPAATVAAAAVALCGPAGQSGFGRFIHHNADMRGLAGG